MSKPTPNKKSRGGTIIALAVVALLVGAPIISYFYLRGGLEYRLESIEQLKEKEVAPALVSFIEGEVPFRNNARLIYFPGRQVSQEVALLRSIDKQIVDRDRFDVIAFTDGQASTDADKHEIQFLGEPSYTPEFQFMLMDTSNVVRSTYEYREDLGKEIIRHLSVVVPVPTSRSVNLNRDDKK